MARLQQIDIQTKIILVLVAVIVPTFLIVTVLENKLTQPILEGEMRQIGISSAESLATKIVSNRWLYRPNSTARIENEIQELLYLQTSIFRMDVFVKDPASGKLKLIASNVVDEDTGEMFSSLPPVESSVSDYKVDSDGMSFWDVKVPIRAQTSGKSAGKILGMVHVLVSTKTMSKLLETFWRITGAAAVVSVFILILVLTYFLRKTVANERLLRVAETQNIQLSQQLHETERQLMNVEKLAVMGQLTANFAHEIGTPLNAIGGHLQLLREEWMNTPQLKSGSGSRWRERVEIISGELTRIEKIVKGFLQTTAKPVSQRQLVDLSKLVDKTVGIVRPRLDSLGVQLFCELDRKMGPIRVVPLDIEQILLNLVSNALDSLEEKAKQNVKAKLELKLLTEVSRQEDGECAEVSVFDTGQGIRKDNLRNVTKPFFTTKRPGEGTGLGLTICSQLASKYGGVLEIDSREGAWAQVKLKIPYRANV